MFNKLFVVFVLVMGINACKTDPPVKPKDSWTIEKAHGVEWTGEFEVLFGNKMTSLSLTYHSNNKKPVRLIYNDFPYCNITCTIFIKHPLGKGRTRATFDVQWNHLFVSVDGKQVKTLPYKPTAEDEPLIWREFRGSIE